MTNSTVQFALVNNTQTSKARAYITGLDLNRNNAPAFIKADGVSLYHPPSPSKPLQPLGVDCAIALGAPGSTRTITVPRLAGARVWFVEDDTLAFYINPGPALVEPSISNPSDPNYHKNWTFCEFTFNANELFVNISYVDMVSLPISLALKNSTGRVETVLGLLPGGLNTICKSLVSQGGPWSKLVIKSKDGSRNLRAVSPVIGGVLSPGLFNGYYQKYVDEVWSKYSTATLTINTQASWGNVHGKVKNGLLTFDGFGTFAKPSTVDIFTCASGPFSNYPAKSAAAMGAIGARISAALNRSTLLLNLNQPESEKVAQYYKHTVTNHYARIVHAANHNNSGYAFPYDDVLPSGGADQSGSVRDGNPALLTVTLGGAAPRAGNRMSMLVTGEENEESEVDKSVGGNNDAVLQKPMRSRLSGLFGWPSKLRKRFGKKESA